MEKYKITMTPLTPTNFHLWIKEVKGIAKKAKVSEYVDPEGVKEKPENPDLPQISDYLVTEYVTDLEDDGAPKTSAVNRPARKFAELSDEQKKSYKMEWTIYQMQKKVTDRIAQNIRIVDAAIKASARPYIPPDKMKATAKDILEILASQYKLSDEEIIEQIHEKFQALQHAPTKAKIETWVAEWENIRSLIVDMNVTGIFGSEIIFVKEFLKAGRPWAPSFCDSWIWTKRAAGKEVEFYETTREYRMAVETHLEETE